VRGEAGSHRRCDPGEGNLSESCRLREPLIPTFSP
jgi:hypothetical protein